MSCCDFCGRVFECPKSQSKLLEDGSRVCRRPCTLVPIFQAEPEEVA